MTDVPRTLTYVLSCLTEVQELTMPYFNRADIINLQVAGIPLNLNRTIQKKHLGAQCDTSKIPRCPGEPPPYSSHCPVGRLYEKTRIGRCEGYMIDNRKKGPARDAEGRLEPPAHHVPHAYHQVCEECLDRFVRDLMWLDRQAVHGFEQELCKTHTAHYRHPSLQNSCTCYATISTPWRCFGCHRSSLNTLSQRVDKIRLNLRRRYNSKKGQWKNSRIRPKKAGKQTSLCPVPKCGQLSWNESKFTGWNSRSRCIMRMCLGCGTVQNIPSIFDDELQVIKKSDSERTVRRERGITFVSTLWRG